MLPLEFVNTHEHVIDEEKPLEQVRVSICFESETACGNSINADEGMTIEFANAVCAFIITPALPFFITLQ